jgi:hypothetical protein
VTYTVRDLYSDLPGHGPEGHGDRWLYPIVVELDGALPTDSDGVAQRSRAVVLDYDDVREVAILKVEW